MRSRVLGSVAHEGPDPGGQSLPFHVEWLARSRHLSARIRLANDDVFDSIRAHASVTSREGVVL